MTVDQIKSGMDDLERRGHARRLGNLENYFAIAQRQDLYSNFGMFCEFERGCSQSELAAAIRGVCLEFPLLLHTVVAKKRDEDAGFYQKEEYLSKPWPDHDYIRVLEKVQMEDVVLNEQPEYAELVEEALERFAECGGRYTSEVFEVINEIRIPYSHQSRPNWRLVCFPEEGEEKAIWRKFLFLSNHCSSDGISAANFFHDLQRHLNQLPSDVAENDVIFDYDRDHEKLAELPSPIEKQISYVSPKSFFARLVGAQVIREYVGYKSPCPTISRVCEPNGNRFHSYFFNITPDQVNSVKQRLKSKLSVAGTLTPYFQACWFAALAKSNKIFTNSFKEQLTNIMVAMNTAQLLPEDESIRKQYRYGANVGGAHYNYQISSFNVADDPVAFWKLVEYYQTVFINAKQKNHSLYSLGALMVDSIYQKKNIDLAVTNALLGKQRLGTMMSNLGYFPQKSRVPSHHKFHILDLVFAQTTGSFRYSFDLNMCATDVGGLNIAACVAEGTLSSRQDWHALCELFKNIILES